MHSLASKGDFTFPYRFTNQDGDKVVLYQGELQIDLHTNRLPHYNNFIQDAALLKEEGFKPPSDQEMKDALNDNLQKDLEGTVEVLVRFFCGSAKREQYRRQSKYVLVAHVFVCFSASSR